MKTAVVVPSFNRPVGLRRCLEALLALQGEPPEIIVVDDGSPTPLAGICAAFGSRVRCIRQENRGPAAARNAGVQASGADFIAFTDDDCCPHEDWLVALRRASGGEDGVLVGGRVTNALPNNLYASASQALCDYLYVHFRARYGDAPFFTSNNMACARAAFDRLGGFDESFPIAAAEDRDFGLRWRADGGSLRYAPEAIVEHSHALDLRRFFRQQSNYGRGARHLHRQLDRRGDGRPKRETFAFYLGLLTYPLRRNGQRRLAQSGLMVVSQAAMIHGYLSEVRVERREKRGGTSES
jgi:GT2 family glycosyltransferase